MFGNIEIYLCETRAAYETAGKRPSSRDLRRCSGSPPLHNSDHVIICTFMEIRKFSRFEILKNSLQMISDQSFAAAGPDFQTYIKADPCCYA